MLTYCIGLTLNRIGIITMKEGTSMTEGTSEHGTVRWMLKLVLCALVVVFAVIGLGCAGGTEVQIGQLVTGTITDSDNDDGEWKSQTYVLEVQDDSLSGLEYRCRPVRLIEAEGERFLNVGLTFDGPGNREKKAL